MRLKSWSQTLFQKVQKSQQNMQSMSLKVKKVTGRLSDCESLFHMTVLTSFDKFWCNHSENKVTVNQSNVLVNVNRRHRPDDHQNKSTLAWFVCDMKINGRLIK